MQSSFPVIAFSLVLALATVAIPDAASSQSCNTADRSVLLILDASGSMNARLPNGETRIEVAKRAVKGVAGFIAPEAKLSLRLYGSQSPRADKDCRDTLLALPFGPAATTSAEIARLVDAVSAQGYTPIAYSLQQAVSDFAAGAGKQRVIVLVSDGKETCDGDPCAAATVLARDGLVIHTVGFIVDTAAREQLKCIARATGGSYFDAPIGPELPDSLEAAFGACKTTVVTLPQKPRPGRLEITSAVFSHAVFNAETGEKVGTFDRVSHQMTLPPGIYEVQFGPSRWKSIEVRPGETTTIAPGVLRVSPNASAEVVDSETGESFGRFDAVTPELTLMPGVYDLRFAKSEWRFVKVDGGATTLLKPVQVILGSGLEWDKARVVTGEGGEVFRFDAVTHKAVLPPGDYIVEVDDNRIPFNAAQGDVLELKPQ